MSGASWGERGSPQGSTVGERGPPQAHINGDKMEKLSEKKLFGPIKEYFEGLGYTCDGEVGDIDLYMEKEGENVAVELKVTFDFKALQQAALRQKVADNVFIGIYKPKDLYSPSFKDKLYLLKRLGIGLIVVSPRTFTVEVVSEPVVSELKNFKNRNSGKRRAISSEFKKRKTKSNVGGVTGTKIISSYREDALIVLDALCELGGEATSREVHKLSEVKKSTDIMYSNYYGWFENVAKGTYKITEKGYDALEEFENVLKGLKTSPKG